MHTYTQLIEIRFRREHIEYPKEFWIVQPVSLNRGLQLEIIRAAKRSGANHYASKPGTSGGEQIT